MGDPEIRNDEKVLVRTPGVYVKSIPFEGILTNKRVILVDRAKNLLPPKEIPLATIKDVETGENAIRDQTLNLSVMAKTGETRQMILTFSRQEGGNRIKERDEWAKTIRQNTGATFDNVIRRVIPGAEPASRPAEPAATPRINVVNAPDQPSPVRREVEGIHPIKKIIDAGTSAPPAPQAPEFNGSAQSQLIFCSRCGNKVPADSAFCNRCGSPVVAPAGAPPQTPPTADMPVASAATFTVPSLRPIDRDIQTIEPLIERSTVKIPSDPLRTAIPPVPVKQSLSWDDDEEETPASPAAETASSAVPSPDKPAAKKGIIPRLFSQKARTHEPPKTAVTAPAGVPPVPEKPGRGSGIVPDKKTLLVIGGIVVAVLIVAAFVMFVYPMLTSGGSTPPSGTADVTPTPTASPVKPAGTFVVLRETPAPVIPVTGVYVHVNYLGGFKGSYGISDALTTVPGNSGDRIWEVENASGTVLADFEKLDGSSHELLVEIYKNGALLTKGTTTIGHGMVKLSVDTDTGVAAPPITSGGGSAAAATPAQANVVATSPAATTAVPGTTATQTPATNTTASP